MTKKVDLEDKSFNESENFLWKIIGRYDSYYSSTNTKGNVLVAFNSFLIGILILKWSEISPSCGNEKIEITLKITMIIISTLGLISLFFTLNAVFPYLKSANNNLSNPQSPRCPSRIFFKDVASWNGADEKKTHLSYLEYVKKSNKEEILLDLAEQTTVLAQGLEKKHKKIEFAIFFIYAELFFIFIFFILNVCVYW